MEAARKINPAEPPPPVEITVGQNSGLVILRLSRGVENYDVLLGYKQAEALSVKLHRCSKQAKRWHP
jgi:hypothetical protein